MKHLIPGGCHTYSKGDGSYPSNAPILSRSKGALTFATYGKPFVDMGMGINNVLIGHAEDSIDDAAVRALRDGQAFSRPSAIEEDAAEAVLSLFPNADMIKFCKNGSDANNAAIRLARAVTGRQAIAFDETAPFFSTADWFCHRQPRWSGTLDAERATTFGLRFNDVQSVEAAFATRPLAAVILELCRYERPTQEFLDAITQLCKRHGTLLIVDEVVTGFRYHQHGAQALFGVEPDLFTLGKGMANGYAAAALLGKREYMARGGQDVFLLSTTNGAEQSALAAVIATVDFYKRHDVIGRLYQLGSDLTAHVKAHCRTEVRIETDFACRPRLVMPPEWRESFHGSMIENSVLWPKTWTCQCFRHTTVDMEAVRYALRAASERVESEAHAS